MAQAPLKKSSTKKATATVSHKKTGITRKGPQNLPPKKAGAIRRQKALTQKFSTGLVAQTERMLGERVGYLELLNGGKKGGNAPKKDGKGSSSTKK